MTLLQRNIDFESTDRKVNGYSTYFETLSIFRNIRRNQPHQVYIKASLTQ